MSYFLTNNAEISYKTAIGLATRELMIFKLHYIVYEQIRKNA